LHRSKAAGLLRLNRHFRHFASNGFNLGIMRSLIKTGILVLALTALPVAAEAGTMEGAAIGAGSGLLIADLPAQSSAA